VYALRRGVYHPAMSSDSRVGAFVLVGGRSSRMGCDKAMLKVGGQALLERTIQCARTIAAEVAVVASLSQVRAAQFAGCGTIVEDTYSDCGPLGGIHAALRGSQRDLNLVLAVDLPGLTAEFLRFLVNTASQQHTAHAVVPEYDGRWHPLCAVYRREFAEAAEDALKLRRYRIDRLFEIVPTHKITHAELEAAGFAAAIFRNVNTMADFELAKRAHD